MSFEPVDDVGAIYERTIGDDGTFSVPSAEAAKRVCVIAKNGMVLCYSQVEQDGTVPTDPDFAGEEVEVVVPSDSQFEEADR